MQNRALLKAADDGYVATYCLEHASVTTSYPFLSFTYGFPEGLDAAEKYEGIGPSQALSYLIGIMKLRKQLAQTAERGCDVSRIGMCTDLIDAPALSRKVLWTDLVCQVRQGV